jgi:hypothetical protein
MKTLKHLQTGEIRRVDDKKADVLTTGNNPKWGFSPKSEWKEYRKSNVVVTETQEEIPTKKTKSGKNKVKKQ